MAEGKPQRARLLGPTEVCESVVKPATIATQSSFCDMFVGKGRSDVVGTAVVFISHAWKYKFLDVVDALKSHFKATPDIIVWFDMFSNNQLKAAKSQTSLSL